MGGVADRPAVRRADGPSFLVDATARIREEEIVVTASEVLDRRKGGAPAFSTAEIKARIEAMFDSRKPWPPTDRDDSSGRHEKER